MNAWRFTEETFLKYKGFSQIDRLKSHLIPFYSPDPFKLSLPWPTIQAIDA